ncbi:MAG: polysaccharide deacetylase family protein [Clostridia bacterium]|nr:polysaccharide deacetylase family protein [Clostridia bacterium]
MKKKTGCLLLLALLALCLPAFAAAEREIPDCLRFRQKMTVTHLGNARDRYVVLPSTALPAVDAEIRAEVERLLAEAEPHLPRKGAANNLASRLDAGPYITRVGSRWMSFLVIGRVTHAHDQLFVDFSARVYNMETGERVLLGDILDEEKGGWDFLTEEAERQLAAHFPEIPTDGERLAALCERNALEERAFTLSPGHITLHFHAHELYPEAPEGLLRVEIYYPDLAPYMTETAIRETDCSGYRLAALTYDDGPSWGVSERVMNQLRLYGAQATFFTVGIKIGERPGVLHREYDSGYSVQSHNWVHRFDNITPENVADWIPRMDAAMSAIIGVGPVMMRAPGGYQTLFIRAGSTLPQIHWSLVSGDASNDPNIYGNVDYITHHVGNARDGDIILCHDLNEKANAFAAGYLPRLEHRNFLLVTVQDLCVLRGVKLEAGMELECCPPQE